MNKTLVTVVTLIATTSSWAAELRFPVTLSGTVQSTAGATQLTDRDLVSSPDNRLVLMIDLAAHVVALEEWDSSLTSKIDRDPVLSGQQGLMENFRMAVVGTTKLTCMANLEMIDVDWNHDGVEDHDGNLQLVAKVSLDKTTGDVSKVSATLVGVLNDSVNGVAPTEDLTFRGKLTTTGPALGTGPTRNPGTPSAQ